MQEMEASLARVIEYLRLEYMLKVKLMYIRTYGVMA